MRLPSFYYSRIQSSLESLLGRSFMVTLAIRLTCILFGIKALLPVFLIGCFVCWASGCFGDQIFVKKQYFKLALSGIAFAAGCVQTKLRYDKHLAQFGHVHS